MERMRSRHSASSESWDPTKGFAPKFKAVFSTDATEGSFVPSHEEYSTRRHDSARLSIIGDCGPLPEVVEAHRVDSGGYSGGFTEHYLPKHSIPAAINSEMIPLHLPEPLPSASVSVSSNFDIRSLAKAHFLAFRPPKPSTAAKCPEWTLEAAIKEVKILRKAFPLVDNRRSLLAMCAWFHLFCFFDDVTEKMPANEARLTMKHSMHILEMTCRTKPTSQNLGRLIGPLQRANIHYTLWLASRLPSGGNVVGATYLFVQQARRLLEPEALKRVAGKIIDVFRGYYREISCREHIDGLSVDDYTQLRSSTIGLSPFWEILRNTFFTEQEIVLAETASFILETHVASVVGLQNDLVGLANDLASQDQMNYVLLRAERESLSIGQALKAGIKLHNWTVRGAVDERYRVERMLPEDWRGSGGMQIYADCMLGFMTTHFMWASNAGRYRPV